MSLKQDQAPRKGRQRLCCHIHLHMFGKGFDLVPKIIGKRGCNMRQIAEATGAKLRIRGKGSGHVETKSRKEADVPLMLAITAEGGNEANFRQALEQTLQLLKQVESRFLEYCAREGIVPPMHRYFVSKDNTPSSPISLAAFEDVSRSVKPTRAVAGAAPGPRPEAGRKSKKANCAATADLRVEGSTDDAWKSEDVLRAAAADARFEGPEENGRKQEGVISEAGATTSPSQPSEHQRRPRRHRRGGVARNPRYQ